MRERPTQASFRTVWSRYRFLAIAPQGLHYLVDELWTISREDPKRVAHLIERAIGAKRNFEMPSLFLRSLSVRATIDHRRYGKWAILRADLESLRSGSGR